MKDLIHLVSFAYIPCFLALPALAQQTSEAITPAPSATPLTAGILRPSSGETITVGEPYTIRWTPPPFDTGALAIELFGRVNSIYRILPNTTSCDGWLINTQCDKLDVNISSGSTSYVWNLSKPYDGYRLAYEEMSFRMGVYEDNLSHGALPRTDAPWYLSASFTLARETTTTTTSRTTSASTTTATTSTSTEGPGTDDSPATPTDAAVPLSSRRWNVVIAVGAWSFLFNW